MQAWQVQFNDNGKLFAEEFDTTQGYGNSEACIKQVIKDYPNSMIVNVTEFRRNCHSIWETYKVYTVGRDTDDTPYHGRN